MMLTRRQVLFLAASCAALAATGGKTRAQAYPAKPVRIVVGFVAGGNFDIVARLLGQSLSEQLRQPVIVENRPGASSNIGTEAVIRAPADGYTLLLGGAVNAVNATLYDNLGFNFISDLAPVAGVVRFPNVMTVGASFPAKHRYGGATAVLIAALDRVPENVRAYFASFTALRNDDTPAPGAPTVFVTPAVAAGLFGGAPLNTMKSGSRCSVGPST